MGSRRGRGARSREASGSRPAARRGGAAARLPPVFTLGRKLKTPPAANGCCPPHVAHRADRAGVRGRSGRRPGASRGGCLPRPCPPAGCDSRPRGPFGKLRLRGGDVLWAPMGLVWEASRQVQSPGLPFSACRWTTGQSVILQARCEPAWVALKWNCFEGPDRRPAPHAGAWPSPGPGASSGPAEHPTGRAPSLPARACECCQKRRPSQGLCPPRRERLHNREPGGPGNALLYPALSLSTV